MTSSKQVALVTGTSSGMGMHAAIQLAQAGHEVVATMRSVAKSGALQKAAEAVGVSVDVRALDVTDDDQARSVVGSVIADYGQIDLLVNNAGQGLVGTIEELSLDGLRSQIELNYIAVARMTQLVLPSMRLRRSGRIVTVTSVGGVVGQPFNEAYCASKFATEGFMESLAPVAARFGVHVSLVEPGAVATEFVANLRDSWEAAEAGVYRDLFAAYVRRTEAAFTNAQTAAEAGAAIVEACTAESPQLRYQTSSAAKAFAAAKLSDVDGSTIQGITRQWVV